MPAWVVGSHNGHNLTVVAVMFAGFAMFGVVLYFVGRRHGGGGELDDPPGRSFDAPRWAVVALLCLPVLVLVGALWLFLLSDWSRLSDADARAALHERISDARPFSLTEITHDDVDRFVTLRGRFTQADLDRVLGFRWELGSAEPEADAPASESVLLWVDGRKVEGIIEDFGDHLALACLPPSLPVAEARRVEVRSFGDQSLLVPDNDAARRCADRFAQRRD